MSRIAKAPVTIPQGVYVKLDDNDLTVKGSKGQLSYNFNSGIGVSVVHKTIQMEWNRDDKVATAQAGIARALINNMEWWRLKRSTIMTN